MDKSKVVPYTRNMEALVRIFPNECFVCTNSNTLVHCTRCNMIRYCGEDHKRKHWERHKSLCDIVTTMLNEQQVASLFHHLRDCNEDQWRDGRTLIANQVQQRLGRTLLHEEELLFRYPRVCFVCYESDPKNLKNCPRCPAATFCTVHPFNHIHDRACAIVRNDYRTTERQVAREGMNLRSLIEHFAKKMRFLDAEELPASIKEFYERFVLSIPLTQSQRLMLSDYFTVLLTIFSALKSVDGCLSTETVIHVDQDDTVPGITIGRYWEPLHHLLQEVKVLKVVYFGSFTKCREEINLCKECRTRKKRLFLDFQTISYEDYLEHKERQKPNLTCFLDTHYCVQRYERNEVKEQVLAKWSKVTSAMLLTTFVDMEMNEMMRWILSMPKKFCVIYEGYNHFASLLHVDYADNGTIGQTSQFMILFKVVGIAPIPKFSQTEHAPEFYASACYVCRKVDPKVACTRCNLIFYCSTKHRDEHRLYHRVVCRVVEVFLNDMKIKHLFEKFNPCVSDLWIKVRMNFKQKVQRRVGRELLNFENEMLYFPRACVVCHEMNPELLKICKCMSFVCKDHQEDPDHAECCQELEYAFKLPRITTIPVFLQFLLTELEIIKDASSMPEFIAREKVIMNLKEGEGDEYSDIFSSEIISGPLTIFQCIKDFNLQIDTSLVIHVMGTTDSQSIIELWSIFFFLMPKLQTLKITFIDTHLEEKEEHSVDTSKFLLITGKVLVATSISTRYENYFSDESFVRPDIIFISNIHFHLEQDADLLKLWNRSFMCWKLLGVPLILTGAMSEFAKKDSDLICKCIGTNNLTLLVRKNNPFASLVPQRNISTQKVQYLNKSVAIFIWNSKNSSDNKKEESVEKMANLSLNE